MAVIEFQPDGTIITANENFSAAMGYSLSEIQGRHHRMFVDAGYAASEDYRQFWGRLNRGEFVASEFKRFAKGNREIWLQASYNPIRDSAGRVVRAARRSARVRGQRRDAHVMAGGGPLEGSHSTPVADRLGLRCRGGRA